MPGARSRVKPLTAGELYSASDEESQLEQYLQRQLEDDIARIFDESINSDLEVVCGKLKILTHSCILKARTHKFYHKLETILHLNIGRNTFDEIYSFISDVYTECNIQHQEKGIISYLNQNLNLLNSSSIENKPKESEEADKFSTPNCVTPGEKLHKSLTSSPSTELTKEYYALVPIEGNLLDKELIEQDALSSAFKSFITLSEDINEKQIKQCVKPTSLHLDSSHISKINTHSISCDIVKKTDSNRVNIETNKVKHSCAPSHLRKVNQTGDLEKFKTTFTDKTQESAYSPDSLITEPSSSSDYLSAAYTLSPGLVSSGCFSQIIMSENTSRMDNLITISDSGVENTGMVESTNSHKDITLTDLSLTESTLHDLLGDEASNSHDGISSPSDIIHTQKIKACSSSGATTSDTGHNERKNNSVTSSKEEKQRQNEEIVILESSSLSSETGSWESVFPPKIQQEKEKDICQTFINTERQNSTVVSLECEKDKPTDVENTHCSSLVQKSPFKSTACFIDAASLADEGESFVANHSGVPEAGYWSEDCSANFSNEITSNLAAITLVPVPRRQKFDDSPIDCSEENANEDSLEQIDKDPDSFQKEGSPTIFDMTPVTEDSLSTNVFDNGAATEQHVQVSGSTDNPKTNLVVDDLRSKPAMMYTSAPNNSITMPRAEFLENPVTLRENEDLRRNYSESGKNNADYNKFRKDNSDSPIISGGVSVEDHLPQFASPSGSPMAKRKIENIPIVSGAYIPEEKIVEKQVKSVSKTSAWVVDMSRESKTNDDIKISEEKCVNNVLKTISSECCKSRSSVDSDSSEKSIQKFYIDLSTLPDAKPSDQNQDTNEKKNIFSMFIDLGDKSTVVKEMPTRLSTPFTMKNKTEIKSSTNKNVKVTKTAVKAKNNDDNQLFERLESLCNDPSLTISEIIKEPASSNLINKVETEVTANICRNIQNEIVRDVIDEEVAPETSDLFVKLSDLDKPIQKQDNISVTIKTQSFERMTRSIPDNNWPELDSSNTTNSRSIDIIASFHSENALSLNRLFPNLKNDFSRSMPGSLSSRTRSPFRQGVSSSPGDIDEQRSDVSEMSSVQSSMCRSVVENSTTEETSQTASLISNCQSRLGQDLLRMFLEEIAPDVVVEVSGRRIKAHKCILSSRCQYFAGILSGGWVESAGDVIALPPFSYGVVHFALCHIYSGVSMIPDSISIVELATIADMLGLEGLKEAIMFTLKAKYCHHFHKPCPVCTAGVLECFPLSSVYGLDDLYRKCLRWITKYFHKVWPTKAFATLPSELLDKCYQEHIINLTTENIVETIYGCGITMSSLQNSRWAEIVSRLCRRVLNAVAQFGAQRLVAIMRCMASLPAEAPPPALRTLNECITAAIEWAPPEEACRAYAFLSHLLRDMRAHHYSKPDLITTRLDTTHLLHAHAAAWRLQCEGVLVRAASRVVTTQAFKELPADLRTRLAVGCIAYGGHAMPESSPLQQRRTRAVSRSSSSRSGNARSSDIDKVRASFVPYAPKPQPPPSMAPFEGSATSIERYGKSKTRSTPVVRSTKAQEERAKYNMTKTVKPMERVGSKTRVTYENTKPRYLEPKARKEREPSAGCGRKKPVPKLVSSSESSRNSSPVIGGAGRPPRRSANVTNSADTPPAPRTADPSTDSLTDSHENNIYATYTKTKRNNVNGSLESMQSGKYQNQTTALNNKNKKTKIPIYLNQTKKNVAVMNSNNLKKPAQPFEKVVNENGSPLMQARNRTNIDRKTSGSLMNATKSSSAKMVPKVVREQCNQKIAKHDKQSGKYSSKQASAPPVTEIPIMERSGTFLKDEPTFGDRTTNLDIDE